MKVMDEAKNLVKSNAPGIGAGSRSAISKDVHCVASSFVRLPRRAKSYMSHLKKEMVRRMGYNASLLDPFCLSNRIPSTGLEDVISEASSVCKNE
jgi:hypothetical protein